MKDNLIYLRKKSKYKVTKIANELGVTRQQLYNIERGLNGLDKLKLEKLCTLYHKSKDEILKAWECGKNEHLRKTI